MKKQLLNIDDIDDTGASRAKRSESQKLRWDKYRELKNNGADARSIRDNVLGNILSEMYFVKWEDSELRDVWEVVTTLKKLGATI